MDLHGELRRNGWVQTPLSVLTDSDTTLTETAVMPSLFCLVHGRERVSGGGLGFLRTSLDIRQSSPPFPPEFPPLQRISLRSMPQIPILKSLILSSIWQTMSSIAASILVL